jgi:hypothetical protein
LVLGIWLVIGLIRSFSGGGMGGGMGGGGFFPGLMGGLFGAMAGAWLYDSFFHSGSSQAFGGDNLGGGASDSPGDFTSSGGDVGGGDFGGGDFGGGDFGGGGDF